jgi:hypothetical protein
MLAKNWKRILLIVLIIACLTNVLIKVVCKNSLQDELQSAVDYVFHHPDEEQKDVITNQNNTEPTANTNNEAIIGPDSKEIDSNSTSMNPFDAGNQ